MIPLEMLGDELAFWARAIISSFGISVNEVEKVTL